MSKDDSANISAKTWNRTADTIIKVGYMDGASDGQTATYQTSFDTGYNQGLNFGFHLGVNEALALLSKKEIGARMANLRDPRKINCHICINRNTEDKIDNLFNLQAEKNAEFFKKYEQ